MSLTDPAAVPPPLAAEHLPDDVATLQRLVLELLASLKQHQRDNESLRHRLDLLLRRLYGPRGERLDPAQLLLFAELLAGADTTAPTAPEEPQKSPRRGKPHGRGRLPQQLPREPRHHELTEAERLCPGCGQARSDIGVDKSEQLEYRPASLFVIEHFVHKYACPCCSRSAATPPGPLQNAASVSQPMPTPPAEPAATPPAAAMPGPTDLRPEPLSPSPESTAADRAPPRPTAPTAVLDPGTIVIAAAKPPMPIAKGLPGPGLLAHLIVSKYVDHLPLHRLERVYERQGRFLPRSTLCDWLAASADLLRPLYEQLVAAALLSRALHTDDTPVKLQDPVSHQLSTARFWVYVGDAAHPYNVFDFTRTRQRDGPQQFLAGYQGYLHADAFSGYDRLYLPDPLTAAARIIEVACNAHARRKFYEARSSAALGSHQALAYYAQLYELERRAKALDFNEDQTLQLRQELALPILKQFQKWLEEQRSQVLPKSPLAEAVGYALNNWTALVCYTEAGFLAIDNNVAEREMKRIAIGRKNWLFVGSARGGQTAAILASFTSTCQRLSVEPWAYLRDVLTRLPTTPAAQLGDLFPDHWQAARQASTATTSGSEDPAPSPAADS
jgi:transposase